MKEAIYELNMYFNGTCAFFNIYRIIETSLEGNYETAAMHTGALAINFLAMGYSVKERNSKDIPSKRPLEVEWVTDPLLEYAEGDD